MFTLRKEAFLMIIILEIVQNFGLRIRGIRHGFLNFTRANPCLILQIRVQ